MSAGTIILIIIGIIILLVLLGIFFFLFSLWKSVFVAREVLDKADTAMEWSKRAMWAKKKIIKPSNPSPLTPLPKVEEDPKVQKFETTEIPPLPLGEDRDEVRGEGS